MKNFTKCKRLVAVFLFVFGAGAAPVFAADNIITNVHYGIASTYGSSFIHALKKDQVNKKNQKEKKRNAVKERTLRAYTVSGKHVSTKCFPPRLRKILAGVKKRYGVKPIVNSGFRSASYNRRVGGARRSYHVKCMAADIKVPGVSKYKLARYLRSMNGVGGVGTYGCKSFVHVDIGPKRKWHWRCSKRRGRRA